MDEVPPEEAKYFIMNHQTSTLGRVLGVLAAGFLFSRTVLGDPIAPEAEANTEKSFPTGNVIFIHPDGAGLSTWSALRLLEAGPDGSIAWDELEHISIYKGHMSDAIGASSNGGATAHAYGVRPKRKSFGTDGKEPIRALSGSDKSIMLEAKEAGILVGAINSGHLCEPGTAVFLASSEDRYDFDWITKEIFKAKPDLYFAGGEGYILPAGVRGVHVGNGRRKDGDDLRTMAATLGIHLIHTTQEMMDLEPAKLPVIGLFADENTYNDQAEVLNILARQGHYKPDAPDVATMLTTALRLFSSQEKPFFLVVEEEGTDNFANYNNAGGTLEAARRANAAIRVALDFQRENPDTLVLVAADSEAGGLAIYGPELRENSREMVPGVPLRMSNLSNGAPLDGVHGAMTVPFLAAPDAKGVRLPFAISWAGFQDFHGGIVVRARGLNADTLTPLVSNVDMYRVMYRTLFGVEPGAKGGL